MTAGEAPTIRLLNRRNYTPAPDRHQSQNGSRRDNLLAQLQSLTNRFEFDHRNGSKPGLFCRRVSGCGPLNRSVRNFESRLLIMGTQQESHLKQNMLFVPFHLHVDVNPRHGGIHSHVLNKGGVLKMFLDPDDGAQRSVLYQLSLIGSINIPMLLFKIGIDVPGVPLLGLVGKNSATCARRSRLRRTAAPRRSTPWIWNTFLAMSNPTTLTSMAIDPLLPRRQQTAATHRAGSIPSGHPALIRVKGSPEERDVSRRRQSSWVARAG